jgi:hypothetical protein
MSKEHINALRNLSFNTELSKAMDSRVVSAISTVLTYMLSDAFDMTSEESIWVGWTLKELLQPLENEHSNALQVAVARELETFEYSQALFERDKIRGTVHTQHDNVKYAKLDEWVEAVTEIIFASYQNVRPMTKSRIIGSIAGLLTELGITNDENSRASLYLPNSLRHIMASRKNV